MRVRLCGCNSDCYWPRVTARALASELPTRSFELEIDVDFGFNGRSELHLDFTYMGGLLLDSD